MLSLFKSPNKIIAEIHHEFDTAEDRLLKQAESIIASTEVPDYSKIENKAERLVSLGFVKSEEVVAAKHYSKQRAEKSKLIVTTQKQAKLIQYYKQQYPFQKFLTEAELDRICEKYNLIYAPVQNYKGIVPEKNLLDIENAKELLVEDTVKNRSTWRYKGSFTKEATTVEKLICRDGIDVTNVKRDGWHSEINGGDVRRHFFNNRNIFVYDTYECETETENLSGLFIAAPKSHFDLKGLKGKGKYGFKMTSIVEIKDPIVFRYVKGGIQVITKWGLEASDESLINEINN